MTISRFSRPLAVLAVIECGIVLAAVLAGQWLLAPSPIEGSAPLVLRLLFLCAMVTSMSYALGLYSWRLSAGAADMSLRLLAAVFLAYIGYAFTVYLFEPMRLPASVLSIGLLLALPAILLLRLAFLRLTDLAQLKSRILVLGTGKQAAHIGDLEQRGLASRFVVVAYVSLGEAVPAVDKEKVIDLPNDFTAFVRRHRINEIVVALEERRGNIPLVPLVAARLRGVPVRDYQNFCEMAEERIDLDALRPSWFLASSGFRTSRLDRIFKRGVDILCSAALLLFTLPLLALTALAVLVESGRPIFYRQERVGRGGKPFMLIKFRSMRLDAEAAGIPLWAAKDDPRITVVGSLIRKARIDEIPQVFNVLRGDMSFVGPRPERPYFVETLAKEIPFYRERHAVKPGITGWAQLNHPYGASLSDARQKLQYDLYYIKYFSIVFDFAIVLQTMRVILWADGAR